MRRMRRVTEMRASIEMPAFAKASAPVGRAPAVGNDDIIGELTKATVASTALLQVDGVSLEYRTP